MKIETKYGLATYFGVLAVACLATVGLFQIAYDGAMALVGAGMGFGMALCTLAMMVGSLLRKETRLTKPFYLWGKPKQMDEFAVSPVIGVILMVAITVILAAIVFVLVSNLTTGTRDAPQITFAKEDDNFTVLSAPTGLEWDEFESPSTGCVLPTGDLEAGDVVTGCAGAFTLRHAATNTIVYRYP